MKLWHKVAVEQERYAGTVCDGCGNRDPYATEVVLLVGVGEEGGGEDHFDFCDKCLMGRREALIAAGSTARILTGEEPS